MRLYAPLFVAFTIAGSLHADDFLCSDGTRLTRDTSAASISVTVDGTTMSCKNITSHEGVCSQSTRDSNNCPGKSLGASCFSSEGYSGMCLSNLGPNSGKSDSDGYPICYCGSGE